MQKMARTEVKKRKTLDTTDESQSNSTPQSNTAPSQNAVTASATGQSETQSDTTDLQVNNAPMMTAKEMLRFSLNSVYDISCIQAFSLTELVDMMSIRQARIVRSQRSKLLNAITELEDKETWNLAQKSITRAKQTDSGDQQNGISRILGRLKNIERRLLGNQDYIFVENSRYNHVKDLISGRCVLEKMGLFKIAESDVYCFGILERSHMIAIVMRLTFKYRFVEGVQGPRFIEFIPSCDTSSPEAQAIKLELVKAQKDLGESVTWASTSECRMGSVLMGRFQSIQSNNDTVLFYVQNCTQ